MRQQAEFVEGKILTRYTSSLDEVFGDLNVTEAGLEFQEKGGIDFQPSQSWCQAAKSSPSHSPASPSRQQLTVQR